MMGKSHTTCLLVASLMLVGCDVQGRSAHDRSKVFKQEYLLKAAREATERGDFKSALRMCDEATGDEYINRPSDKQNGLVQKLRILRIMGEYDEALAIYDEFISYSESEPRQPQFIDELKALNHYSKTKDKTEVYVWIKKAQEDWADYMPPKGFSSSSVVRIADILRLYDTIGDLDAGIAYIDEVLAFFRTGKAGDPKPGRVDAEFIKIREAFEQDKRDGTKGRATKAIIQSDYFPW